MTDKQLLRTVKGFRKGVLGKKEPAKQCYAVSFPLQGYLSVLGLRCRLEEACVVQGDQVWYHWFLIMLDGRIIDATASQFIHPTTGERMPDVYIGERPFWYQKNKRKHRSESNPHSLTK